MESMYIYLLFFFAGLIIYSLSRIIGGGKFKEEVREYFQKKGFQDEPLDLVAEGHIRDRAIRIDYYWGIINGKSPGLTIRELTVQTNIYENYYLKLNTRRPFEESNKEVHRWTDDEEFDSLFFLASSPPLFAGTIFGPRPALRSALKNARIVSDTRTLQKNIRSLFILEVKKSQVLLKGEQFAHYYGGHYLASVDQLDQLLNLLCDLADAVEETAASLQADPIPDSALN